MRIKLKPTTQHSFTKQDLEFAMELAKVGHVHLLSNQITLTDVKGSSSSNLNLQFKEYGDNGCDGMKLPDNWLIEEIYASERGLSITFGVIKIIER